MKLKSYTDENALKQRCGTIGGSLNRSWCRGKRCISWQKNPSNNEEGGCIHLNNKEAPHV